MIELAALLHEGAPLSTADRRDDAGTTALHLETVLTSDSRTLVQVGPANTITYGWNRLLGTATVNGQPVGVDMQASVQYTSGNGPFSGFVTFTFADGSTLGVSMQGVTAAQPNTSATFSATLGVIGGTGTYLEAKGSGTFTGTRQTQLGGQVQSTFDLDLQGSRSADQLPGAPAAVLHSSGRSTVPGRCRKVFMTIHSSSSAS